MAEGRAPVDPISAGPASLPGGSIWIRGGEEAAAGYALNFHRGCWLSIKRQPWTTQRNLATASPIHSSTRRRSRSSRKRPCVSRRVRSGDSTLRAVRSSRAAPRPGCPHQPARVRMGGTCQSKGTTPLRSNGSLGTTGTPSRGPEPRPPPAADPPGEVRSLAPPTRARPSRHYPPPSRRRGLRTLAEATRSTTRIETAETSGGGAGYPADNRKAWNVR